MTNFSEDNIPSTKVLPCVKELDQIVCEYYITTIQPDATPDGLVYEIVNLPEKMYFSGDKYNECREENTAEECEAVMQAELDNKITRRTEQEVENLKQLQEELDRQNAYNKQETPFNTEFSTEKLKINNITKDDLQKKG
jgi:hypothetical protein